MAKKDGTVVTRCKFTCAQVTHRKDGNGMAYDYVFLPVLQGSPENTEFFKYTPSGRLEFSGIKADGFEVGEEYYLDLSLAVQPAPAA